MIYASGFLVVTTHLERFGIRVEGTDVSKTRYIHIGVLAMCLPAMIVGTWSGMWYLFRIRERELADEPTALFGRALQQSKEQFRHLRLVFKLSGGVSLLMELAFYAFVMFDRHGPPGDPDTTRWRLVWMLVAGLGFLILAWKIEKGEGRIEKRGGIQGL